MGNGAAYGVKEVDSLFFQMDKDQSGELDLQELNIGLKVMKEQYVEAANKAQLASETAAACRARAEEVRKASEKVAAYERACDELEAFMIKPSADASLQALLARRGVKSEYAIAKITEAAKEATMVDADSFCATMAKLNLGVSDEELRELFTGLLIDEQAESASGEGIQLEALCTIFRSLSNTKQAAEKTEKRLSKAVDQAEAEAKSAQAIIKQLLADDAKREAERLEAERAEAEEAEKAKATAEQEARKKAAAAAKAAAAEKKDFEARIRRKRMTGLSSSTPVVVDATPDQKSALEC